nr:nucleotide-binding alpha-beta plait domain-containing protein [Tanacetum cinerariifolium]
KALNEENVPTQSNDPPLSRVNTLRSGEDRLKLNELMELCTKLSERVLNLEITKTAQAREISRLKKRFKRLEKKKKLRTYGLKRLYKGRKITDIDADKGLTLIDETTKDPRRINNEEMFDTDVLNDKEVVVEDVNAASITTAATTAATTVVSIDYITLAQALVEIKTSKPKAKSIVIFDEQESRRSQVDIDEQDRLAEEKAQLIEDENLAWDNIQAMIDAYFELAARLQEEVQGELTVEEKLRLFVKLMDKRKKHFARLRAKEQRRKPLTKAQKRNQMCIYLKNMARFTHNQLKNKSFNEVQTEFDITMSWINSFVPMDSEVVKDKVVLTQESNSKRVGDELDQKNLRSRRWRFMRPPAVKSGGYTHQNGKYMPKKTKENSNNGRRIDKMSYVNVVNGDTKSIEACEPTLLLDESCLNQLDYSLGLLGKVKEFSSFDNIRMVLRNKGFNDIDL